jgi:hypothetical protein
MQTTKKWNKLFLLAMFGMVLALGLVLVGCDDGKSDDDPPGGGGVPSELVGEWYSKASDTKVFEITSENKLIVDYGIGSSTYDASVSGTTVTMLRGSYAVGTFDFSISGGELTITNGTSGCASFPALSPLIKK